MHKTWWRVLAFLFLFWSIASHLIFFPLGGYRVTRVYSVYLFCLYALFILLAPIRHDAD